MGWRLSDKKMTIFDLKKISTEHFSPIFGHLNPGPGSESGSALKPMRLRNTASTCSVLFVLRNLIHRACLRILRPRRCCREEILTAIPAMGTEGQPLTFPTSSGLSNIFSAVLMPKSITSLQEEQIKNFVFLYCCKIYVWTCFESGPVSASHDTDPDRDPYTGIWNLNSQHL